MEMIEFCENVLGMKLYPYQKEALKDYKNKRINNSRMSGDRKLYYEMLDKMSSILNSRSSDEDSLNKDLTENQK